MGPGRPLERNLQKSSLQVRYLLDAFGFLWYFKLAMGRAIAFHFVSYFKRKKCQLALIFGCNKWRSWWLLGLDANSCWTSCRTRGSLLHSRGSRRTTVGLRPFLDHRLPTQRLPSLVAVLEVVLLSGNHPPVLPSIVHTYVYIYLYPSLNILERNLIT